MVFDNNQIVQLDDLNIDRVWVLSAWQLIQLALINFYANEINVALYASKVWDPAAKIINPKTNKPFVSEDDVIVVPNYEKQSIWTNIKFLDEFLAVVWKWNPITLEWENIPFQAIEYIESKWFEVFPNSQIVKTIQDRVTEKQLIKSKWLSVVNFAVIESKDDIVRFMKDHENAVLKTRRDWYDWHWQVRINSEEDIDSAWNVLSKTMDKWWLIIEEMIDLDYEVSVIIARDRWMNVGNLAPSYNIHDKWILRTSISPAPIDPDIEKKIIAKANELMEKWEDYIWILTIEFFISKSWEIYVNELAPRTHNSWHLTIDNGWTSQNDLWRDSITTNSLKVINATNASVMINLLDPDWLYKYQTLKYNGLLDPSIIKFYDYLKFWNIHIPQLIWDYKERKVWHVNFIGDEIDRILEEVRAWRKDKAELDKILKWL